MSNKNATNWYEELGQAVAEEAGLTEGSNIEHQCGTVWVTDSEGTTIAITGMETEDEEEDEKEKE